MKVYESKIPKTKRRICNAIAGVGFIAASIGIIVANSLGTGNKIIDACGFIPFAIAIFGLSEILVERVAHLNRILPMARLMRGSGTFFAAETTAVVYWLAATIAYFNATYLTIFAANLLCFPASCILFFSYKRKY